LPTFLGARTGRSLEFTGNHRAFSQKRLEDLFRFIRDDIAEGKIPDAVMPVGRP
jgi:hypothetical protein